MQQSRLSFSTLLVMIFFASGAAEASRLSACERTDLTISGAAIANVQVAVLRTGESPAMQIGDATFEYNTNGRCFSRERSTAPTCQEVSRIFKSGAAVAEVRSQTGSGIMTIRSLRADGTVDMNQAYYLVRKESPTRERGISLLDRDRQTRQEPGRSLFRVSAHQGAANLGLLNAMDGTGTPRSAVASSQIGLVNLRNRDAVLMNCNAVLLQETASSAAAPSSASGGSRSSN